MLRTRTMYGRLASSLAEKGEAFGQLKPTLPGQEIVFLNWPGL